MTIKVASSAIFVDAPDIRLPLLALNFRLRSCEITHAYLDARRIQRIQTTIPAAHGLS